MTRPSLDFSVVVDRLSLCGRAPIRLPSRRLLLILWAMLLIGCSTQGYRGADLAGADFLQRAITQEDDALLVTAAVPDAAETRALTGLDLYGQGIQPVWLKIENRGTAPARIALWSIDRDYFSPIEVAYMNRERYSDEGYVSLESWFLRNGLERVVPPGESRSGLVFTHLKPGTKGFNLDIFSNRISHSFTFFIPLPGFTADYAQVDFANLYRNTEILQLDPSSLKVLLEQDFPCCTQGPKGEANGAPFNTVLVGTPLAVRRSLLRGGWMETEADSERTQRARELRYRGRSPDAIFHKVRKDGDERMALVLWRAPWEIEGQPGWVGVVFYTELQRNLLTELADANTIRDTALLNNFVRESVAADMDGAARRLLQNLWYNQSLRAVGFVKGLGESTPDNPRVIFNGVGYFTDGYRFVLFLSETPVALSEGKVLYGREYIIGEGVEVFEGEQVPAPNDRIYIHKAGDLTVTTAVPSAEETEAIFGTDLYRENIQPVWVQVENRGDVTLYLTPAGLDPDYYSPRESAARLQQGGAPEFSSARLEHTGYNRMQIAPNSVRSGYVFSTVDEGTKAFNVDVLGSGKPYIMSFFVPVPGLKLDHYEVDIDGIYPESELKHVDLAQLVNELEHMPCCVRDEAGKDRGDPLNLVFVGDKRDLYYAFLRAGWDETETIYGTSLLKMAASSISGGLYRYSPVSALYVAGRPQDAALQRARSSINERNHLRIWLTPLRFEGKPVWIGQISRDIGVHLTWRTITTHKIDPNVDETREFLLEDMAYSQGLAKFGYVGGVGSAPYDQPRGNLTGDPYFTDGRRVVMWVTGEQSSISDIEVMDLSPWYTGYVSD